METKEKILKDKIKPAFYGSKQWSIVDILETVGL